MGSPRRSTCHEFPYLVRGSDWRVLSSADQEIRFSAWSNRRITVKIDVDPALYLSVGL